jgi:hypothetical protein
MSLNISGSVVDSSTAKLLGSTMIIKRGLILHWDASSSNSYSGTGTGWYDLTGNMYNGVLTNGTTYSSTNGGYFSFDGTDDFVAGLSGTFMNAASTGTFEIWMSTSTISGYGMYGNVGNLLIAKASSSDCGLGFNGSDKIRFRLNGTNLDSATSISTNNWYQIVGTWNTSGMKIYINGAVDATNVNAQTWETSTHATQIGRMYVGNTLGSFYGKIGSVKVYDRLLEAAEILQNYNVQKSRYGL